MADFTFKVSSNIMLGSYTASRVGQFALEYGTRAMLIIDPILKENGIADKIKQSLSDRNVEFFVFDELSEGVTTKTIEAALNIAKDAHLQSVIAAGGTKTMCVARAVASVLPDVILGADFYSFVDGALPSSEPLPLVCVPTAIRDFSIFTQLIPVIDSRSSRTRLMTAKNSLGKLVIFDPNLNVTLSQNQIDSITMEVLCLITEAYLSQRANFFSDMLAEKAAEFMRLIGDDAATLVTTPQEELLAQCGCLASLAIGTSAIGAASLLSLCVNARFKIPRSLVSAILLPYVIADCSTFKLDRVAKLARILGVSHSDDTDEQAANSFAETVRMRIAKANLPARLKDLNVTIEQLSLAVEDAASLEYVNSLPRSMNSDTLFELVKTAF
mgnify:CR=1 FL=1